MTNASAQAEVGNRISNAAGVILDMDGTILDSYESHYRAWNRILGEHGYHYTREEIVAQFGKPTTTIAAILFKSDDKGFIARTTRRKVEYFLEQIPRMALFPGTLDVLSALKAHGKRACIASSSSNVAIARVIDGLGLSGLIDAFVGLEDITNGKPDPEIIFKSCGRLGLAPSSCIVVGDTEYDVKAGNAAGCSTIAVLTGENFTREQLVAAGATIVIPTIADLLPLLKV
ncbi:MAG: HAD family phosphatase [Candidatus Lokiarchaeota archaeon]|nr:HAD family phosphatase [Candidatus Lokiarchaeota archaeon]